MILLDLFVVLLLIKICGSELDLQHAGYYSLQNNFTVLTMPKGSLPYACASIPSQGIVQCGLDNYHRIVLRNTSLQGLVEVSVLTSPDAEWVTLEYYVTTEYDSIHILSDSIIVNYPKYGDLQSNVLNMSFSVNSLQYPSQYFEVAGIYNNTFQTSLLAKDPLVAHNIEPASWFYKAFPAVESNSGTDEASWMLGLPTHGYVEFVLSNSEILKHRRFSSLQDDYKSKEQTEKISAVSGASHEEKINICLWTSPNMDGQKSIWLQQAEFMDQNRFHFTWLLAMPGGKTINETLYPEILGKNNVYSHLKKMRHVKVIDNPYNAFALDLDKLSVRPDDGTPSAGEVWNNNVDTLYKYIHDRLAAVNYDVSRVNPVWCREFYESILQSMLSEDCDVAVYGNARGFSSDVFIIDAARLLGIPSVTELLNLYLDIDCIPDAVVAPSTYAVEHESISTLDECIASHKKQSPSLYGHIKVPLRTVIPPSVDAKVRFNPSKYKKVSSSGYSHGCEGATVYSDDEASRLAPCISIGFVARLSPEKSPGLFLQAAYEILQMYPFARFTFIGDGLIAGQLKQLTERLRISWAVSFLGWVSDDLPLLLKTFDIVVNPSLRAWSETFCIANIEVMSMEVPLVTFGVGGIGEYVRGPPANTSLSGSSFTVTSNAVLVNTATPTAVAEAVHYLITNPDVRIRLGKEGRKSVERFFTVERQMEQYSKLYSDLFYRRRR